MNAASTVYFDPKRWPHLLESPRGRFQSRRAKVFTQRLEALLNQHGVASDSGTEPHLVVHDGAMLDRVVADGWLGVGESYLLHQWSAEPLSQVLQVLLTQPLEDKFSSTLGGVRTNQPRHDFGPVRSGDLPPQLVELFAGATLATGSALFASSPRTTSTVSVGGDTASAHPVDVTWYGSPTGVERADLDDAQVRRVSAMLDQISVGPGDRVLELPSSGGELAIQAARRGASVDVLTSDEDHARVVEERVHAAGVAGGVRVVVISGPIPSPRQWSGRYDAIFSVERLETLGQGGIRHFVKSMDRMLAPGGAAVIQTCVATGQGQTRPWVREALDLSRAYVWPALDLVTTAQLHRATEEHTRLRVVAETHLGPHLQKTVQLWRSLFAARERQAAAAGFDQVFRRLWDYHLAVYEALVAAGDMDCVQFVLRPRD